MTDDIFDKPEKEILEHFVRCEIEKQSFDPAQDLPFVQTKKLVYTWGAAVTTIILLSLYFRTGVQWAIPIDLVVIWLYLWRMKSCNTTAYIVGEMKARPDDELSLIVSELRTGMTVNRYRPLLYVLIITLSITIPLVVFRYPKMDFIYEGAGYYVSNYSRAVIADPVVYIPESYLGEPVVGIRGNAFSNHREVYQIVIPNTVTDIHGEAFQNCHGLTTVNIPTGVTEIRGNTFENCEALREIVIPEGVTRIAAYAFYNCDSLSEVTVPASVVEIGSSAFRNCDRLTAAYIAKGTVINERSFKESPTAINFY